MIICTKKKHHIIKLTTDKALFSTIYKKTWENVDQMLMTSCSKKQTKKSHITEKKKHLSSTLQIINKTVQGIWILH
jgi:hypothetical protein